MSISKKIFFHNLKFMYRYILKSSTSDCWQLWFAVSNFLFPAPSFSSAAPSTALSAEFSLSQKINFFGGKEERKS